MAVVVLRQNNCEEIILANQINICYCKVVAVGYLGHEEE